MGKGRSDRRSVGTFAAPLARSGSFSGITCRSRPTPCGCAYGGRWPGIAAALIAGLAGAAVIVTAAVLVIQGIAAGLTVLCGGRAWAGDLLAGVLVLAAVGLGMFAAVRSVLRASRRRTLEKYEHRRKQQREELGRDVQGAAGSRTSPF